MGSRGPLPCFRSTVLSWRLPSLPSGPGLEPGSPSSSVLRRALRLPARANLVPYGFGCRPHAPLLCSCIAEALLTGPERSSCQAWNTWSAWRFRARHVAPVGACGDPHRFSWRPIAYAPLPCSRTPAEPTKPRLSWSCRHRPRPTQTEGLSLHIISRLTQGFSIRCIYASTSDRCRRPCKTSLPAGKGCASTREGARTL